MAFMSYLMLFKFSSNSLIFSLSSLITPINIVLNSSRQFACLKLIQLFFCRISCSFIQDLFPCLCIFIFCFYVLGRVALSSGFDRVALCSRFPIRPSDAASPVPGAGCYRCTPVWPVCTVPLQFSLGCCWCHWKGIMLRPIGCEDWLQLQLGSCCARVHPMKQDMLRWGFGTHPVCPMRRGRAVIWCGLKLSIGCTGSGVLQEVQSQPPAVPCLGLLGMLQSDLQMAATCFGFRGVQERPQCEPRWAATNARPVALIYGVCRSQVLLV